MCWGSNMDTQTWAREYICICVYVYLHVLCSGHMKLTDSIEQTVRETSYL